MRKALRYLAAILAIAFTHSIQAANPPRLPARAERLIVSKVVFYDATLEQCVDFLLRESVKLDPDGAGIKLKLGGPKDEATLIRMSMRQVPVGDVIKALANRADLEIRVDGESILLNTKLKEPRLRGSVPAVRAADSPKLPAKAERLIIPRLEFRDTTIAEAVEFLERKSREVDPDRAGVKISLDGHKDDTMDVNLSVQRVPVGDVVRMLAMHGDLEISVESESIHLKSKLKAPQPKQTAPAVPTIPGLDPVPVIPK